ncbi:MAG TPA: sigma-70 family RNA polymerase sigma factor [Thermoanaerobaculia bacterium]|jgi:RNA polymerase sigma factor (sigma-70 family)|nr:sigma-70 family RNA polymerase sigma factor [Thermoanaerobaculia bacterium]
MDFYAFDDDYVRRLREGDRWTENHFANYFTPLLALRLRGRIRPSTDIPDIIQDVFVAVYTGLRGDNPLRDGRALGAYVFGICRNLERERIRAAHPTEEIDPDIPDPNEDVAFKKIVTQQTIVLVYFTLDLLGKRDADILREIFLQELDKDEVCRRHRVDRNYLRVLIHRALEKFREKLDDS